MRPALLALFLALPLRAAVPDIPVQYGPHAVGFRVVLQYDESRTYRRYDSLGAPVANPARPLETLIWYPAAAAGAQPMNFADYLDLIVNEEQFGAATALEKERAAETLRGNATDADWRAFRALGVHAYHDAPAAQGHFPLVVYAPSLSAVAFNNSVLCEALASHGYVVVATPSLGPHARAQAGTVEGAEAQARDIEFLIAAMRSDPHADTSRTAVIGYSWGGIANVFAAVESPATIRALVCLDGSIRYYYSPTFTSWPGRSISSLGAPILFFAQKPFTIEELTPQNFDRLSHNNFFNDLVTADWWVVTMYRMRHADFGSNNIRLGAATAPTEYSPQEIAASYAWVARYTREFLDAQLKDDAAAKKFLDATPAENGVPPHVMSIVSRKATAPALGIDQFAHLAAMAGGLSHVSEVLASVRKSNPNFTLDEGEVIGWGYTLLSQAHADEAVAVFRLDTELNPKSWNAWDSLGEALAAAGRKDEAIASYRKSLELNPANTNGEAWLQKLTAK